VWTVPVTLVNLHADVTTFPLHMKHSGVWPCIDGILHAGRALGKGGIAAANLLSTTVSGVCNPARLLHLHMIPCIRRDADLIIYCRNADSDSHCISHQPDYMSHHHQQQLAEIVTMSVCCQAVWVCVKPFKTHV
jgi:hypothetical protein